MVTEDKDCNFREVFKEMRFSSFTARFVIKSVSPIIFLMGVLGCVNQPSSFTVAPSTRGIPPELKDVAVTERLGGNVAIDDFTFKDESGAPVQFSSFFKKGHPVLFAFHYNRCTNICDYLLKGLVSSLKELDWTPGQKFELVTLSIDPTDTPEFTARKKEGYLRMYGRPEAASGWHFLTGEESQIQKLASQLGYGFKYDPSEKQYGHSAVIFALTPEGKISRYLYGIEYPSKDLKLALLEASNGKIGTVIDRFILFCFQYDPVTRRYSIYLSRLMQTSCGGTVLVFGAYLAMFWRRQRKGA
jgi:protein SCO1/2